ncbi:unnamed protein product [Rotaria socialis]|uniref:PARP catalytic domain-containing protein n=1 Tax=Rotaria socialis TaxID=392032 RepID=A0A821JLJ6_9BILA|nr:unnamed protein product [Rotaria socialis]CAF4716962.1 unnamed protein product [Rotaria socialis]
MSSINYATPISPTVLVYLSEHQSNEISVLSENERTPKPVDQNEESDQDEGINDELQIAYEEQIISAKSINNTMPIENTTNSKKDSHFHPLLENDIKDVFSKVSTNFLAGFSYESATEDSSSSMLTFHFYTDYIEIETACQWQICHKKPLICQILVHNETYLDQNVIIKHIYQTCECHPENANKVPFIERLIRDYFERVHITMETLRLSRAAFEPDLRLKYFLELVSDKSKRTQYEELLLTTNDQGLLDELLDYEILDTNTTMAKKLGLLKLPRSNFSNKNPHYDLNVKNLPNLNYGYLVQFCKYFEYRMRNLNSLCVMCGKRTLDLVDQKQISKPTICDDYTCFSDAMDSKFRDDPLPPSIFSIEIADFLLLLVYAAIHSNRYELILDPYPKLINPYNTSTTLLDQHGNQKQNIHELRNIIDQIMTMGSITQYEAVKISLRSMIELKHPWGFSFFHWLMGTNRYHFSLIPETYQIKSINTQYQYFIKHEDIVKHVNFKKLRAEKGSIFAFHGSPQENWHSILRSGLQIGKGGYLINGAAYGAGIYASPSFIFSTSYTRVSRLHDPSTQFHSDVYPSTEIPPLKQRGWHCIALCEIINSPDAYKKHSKDIWTIQDPNLICTRFIFFFSRGTNTSNLRVDAEPEASSIRALIHTLNNIAC